MKKEQIFSFRSDDLEGLRERVQRRELLDKDYQLIQGIVAFVIPVLRAAEEMRISLRRLQNLLFGKKTEKSRRSRPGPPSSDDDDPSPGSPTGSEPDTPASNCSNNQDQRSSGENRSPGHGRMGASAYLAAETIHCSHPDLQAKQPCPCCRNGTLYLLREPSIEIRILGSPVLSAKEYELERLRCSSSGAVLTAPLPADAPLEKYDARAKVIVAVLKYGYGMPFFRLGQLQVTSGFRCLPLPSGSWSKRWPMPSFRSTELSGKWPPRRRSSMPTTARSGSSP